MAKLHWLGAGVVVLTCGWFGCSGSEVSSGNGALGGSSGNAGSGANAGNGGTAGTGGTSPCQIDCAAPPPGCVYVGQPTCDPPKCPPLFCADAGADAAADVTCSINCPATPSGCHYEGQVTCNPPTCPPIVCEDAGPDAQDGSLPDAGDFAWYLDGIWLIGWSGGMNHYSWVRMSGAPNWGGDAAYLDGADLLSNVPFWACSGAGSWMVTQKPYTVGFNFPSVCSQGFAAYTFLSFDVPTSGPPNANLHAVLEPEIPGQQLEGWRFPADQCDAAMTTCKSPWP